MTSTPTGQRDSLGIDILVGDRVRVLGWGAPVRLADVGRTATVVGVTAYGSIRLAAPQYGADPIARGRAVPPGMLGVLDREDRDNPTAGYQGNRHT